MKRLVRLAGFSRQRAIDFGFGIFEATGHHLQTVTFIKNTSGIDYAALSKFLKGRGLAISNGYGDLRGKTLRIAHMGDVTNGEMQEVLDAMSEFVAN